MYPTTRVVPDWGKTVKKTLIDRDMSMAQLAKELDISRPHLSNVINGALIYPELQKKICDYLGIPST